MMPFFSPFFEKGVGGDTAYAHLFINTHVRSGDPAHLSPSHLTPLGGMAHASLELSQDEFGEELG